MKSYKRQLNLHLLDEVHRLIESRHWRSKHQHEVDFTIGNHTAIETKASKKFLLMTLEVCSF